MSTWIPRVRGREAWRVGEEVEAKRRRTETGVETAVGVPDIGMRNSVWIPHAAGPVHEICQIKTINNYNGAARAEEGAAAAAGEVADKNDCRLLGVPRRCWVPDLADDVWDVESWLIDSYGLARIFSSEPHCLLVLEDRARGELSHSVALATEAAYMAKNYGFTCVVWADGPGPWDSSVAESETHFVLSCVLRGMGVNVDTRRLGNDGLGQEIKKQCTEWRSEGITSLLILNGVRDDGLLAHLRHFTAIIVTTDVAGFGEGKVANRQCLTV